jgi:putative flippase GtrA
MRLAGEAFRYALIGVIVTVLYGIFLTLSVELLGLRVVPANALTFFVANLCAYFLHSRFSFRRTVGISDYLRFFSSYVASCSVSLLLAAFAEWRGWHYLVGFVLITSVTPVFSFVLLKLWVFKTTPALEHCKQDKGRDASPAEQESVDRKTNSGLKPRPEERCGGRAPFLPGGVLTVAIGEGKEAPSQSPIESSIKNETLR